MSHYVLWCRKLLLQGQLKLIGEVSFLFLSRCSAIGKLKAVDCFHFVLLAE